MITFSPDKFGFYQAGELKTYRKLEAIQVHDRTGHFPEWNFNREAFDQVDWFQEPTCDLWSLYLERCRQIRKAYDYCVIFYSGGSDSENIVKAWIDAGCRLDEIATINIHSITQPKDDFDWAVEIDQVAEPFVRQLQSQGIQFFYREIDSVQHVLDYLSHNIDDYFYRANQGFSPNNTMKSRLREIVPDYQRLIDSGKRLCFIWGSDKPQIRYDSAADQWFIDFFDLIDNCVSPHVQENYHKGWFDELFYWTPDLPLMLIKQAHELRRWCTTIHDPQFYQSTATPYGYNRSLGRYLTPAAAKLAIYPRWQADTIVASKPRYGYVRPGRGYMLYSERDRWFFSSNEHLRTIYDDQVNSIMRYLASHSRWDWLAKTASDGQTIWSMCRQSHRFA